MLIDPQVVTVNAIAKTMPRVENVGKKSIYQLNDQTFTLTISHVISKDQRLRSMVRIDQRAIVADPLTAVNDWETLTTYRVIDRPLVGFTAAQVEQLVFGHKAWETSAILLQLYGQET